VDAAFHPNNKPTAIPVQPTVSFADPTLCDIALSPLHTSWTRKQKNLWAHGGV